MLDLFSERKVATSWDPVEGESHLDTLLRAIVISRLGKAGDQVFRKISWSSIILPAQTSAIHNSPSCRRSELRLSEGSTHTALVEPVSRLTSGSSADTIMVSFCNPLSPGPLSTAAWPPKVRRQTTKL